MKRNWTNIGAGRIALAAVVIGTIGGAFAQGNNQPSGQAGGTGTSNVVVTNTAAQPVPVKNLDNPAKQPFQWHNSGVVATGSDRADFTFQVPAGKRLVIEQLSGEASVVSSSGTVPRFLIASFAGGAVASGYAPATYVGNDLGMAPAVYANQQLRMYADPGTTVSVEVQRSTDNVGGYSGHVNFTVSVTGYLVDIP